MVSFAARAPTFGCAVSLRADVLVHVVDGSGDTDSSGNSGSGGGDPAADVEWVYGEVIDHCTPCSTKFAVSQPPLELTTTTTTTVTTRQLQPTNQLTN